MPSPGNVTPSPTRTGDAAQVALATTVAACAIGASYGFLVAYVPFAHLAAPFGIVACGYLVAWVAEQLLTARRVRHWGLAVGIPLAAGTIGYYIAWVAWVAAVHDHRLAMALLWRPLGLASTLIHLGDAGTWSLLEWRPGRFESWVMWLSELVLYYLALHIGADAAARRLARPYCVRCRQWVAAPVVVGDLRLGWLTPEQYTDMVLRRRWEELEFVAASSDPDNCHRFSLARCACGTVRCLTVDRRTREPGIPTREQRLVDSLLLESGEPARIAAIMERARTYRDASPGA